MNATPSRNGSVAVDNERGRDSHEDEGTAASCARAGVGQLSHPSADGGVVGEEPSMPARRNARASPSRSPGANGSALERDLQRQELVLHPERERVHDQVEPVRVSDDRSRGEQPTLRVARDQHVLARADPVGGLDTLRNPARVTRSA